VVALINFLGAYFAVREAQRRSNPVRRAHSAAYCAAPLGEGGLRYANPPYG
jgi:hypothetical protein